jgi:hypothetical protein
MYDDYGDQKLLELRLASLGETIELSQELLAKAAAAADALVAATEELWRLLGDA